MMMKAIIVCFLSFCLCFSALADNKGNPATLDVKLTPNDAAALNPVMLTSKPAITDSKDVDFKPSPKTPTTPTTNEKKIEKVNETVVDLKTVNNTKPGAETESKNNTSDQKQTEAPKNPSSPVPAPVDGKNKTGTQESQIHNGETGTHNITTGNGTITVSTSTTEAPKKSDETIPAQARGFDGGSFIGGIILTLGLLAIGFMGYKYYKTQTERNYHTL